MKIHIFEGVNLTVSEGEIFGFLGPNGAGKTTTIRMIMNIICPDSGRVEILGHELRATTHLFLWGTVVFSGSLYALALGAPSALGAITPLGGVALIAGWVALALAARGV